ncbi:MAG: hypothetical protein FJX35_10820 [Alphaproteobacteria bacterium]|nr:hypothetical protein [Alphaproteobacteria bacterium]
MTDGTWVIAELDGALIGVAAEAVLGVIAPPPVTPIPFAPHFVDGLIGAAGDVVPLIDLGRCLDMAATGQRHDVMRLKVGASHFCLLVDRVVSLAQLTLDDGIESATDDGFTIGTWRWQDRSVRLLDAARLGIDDIAAVEPSAGAEGLVGQASSAEESVAGAAEEKVVVVELGGDRFALPLAGVNEVIEINDWTPVPAAALAVLGLAFPRDAPLLLLSLGRLIGRHQSDGTAHRFVVVERDGARFGLAVDRVIGMRSFRPKDDNPLIEAAPGIEGHYIEADNTPVGAIVIERLIEDALLNTFRTLARSASIQATAEARVELQRFLTFAVGAETCALPIEAIERVIEYSDPHPLPDGGLATVKGAIEVQGRIVPVMLASEWLANDRGTTQGTDTVVGELPGAYVVLRLDEGPVALAVDRLHRILAMPVDRIEAFGRGGSAIAGVARLDGHVLWVLAADRMAGAGREAAVRAGMS